jgi:hypothetical protein
MMKVMVMLLEQNEKLFKKIKEMNDTIETIAESVDTLIEIESQRIKSGK